MSADKQPLYKVLKNKITPGEWEAKQSRGNNLFEHKVFVSNVKTIAEMEADFTDEIPVIKANAEYTALAVNNLHHLADAMGIINKFLNSSAGNHCPRPIKSLILWEIKEALNRIS